MPTPRKYPTAAARQAAYRLRAREHASRLGAVIPLPGLPGRRRWEALGGQALQLVAQMSQELEAYYEARTERWQESERGEAFLELQESVAQAEEALRELLPHPGGSVT